MDEGYSFERVVEIFNDRTGEKISVGPDRDSLGLVEIRTYTDDGKIGERICLTQEQARLVAKAITELYQLV